MRVERTPTLSTMPSTSPTLTQSPSTKGLSATMDMEPNKFAIVSLEAKAKAAPPIPKETTKALIFTPMWSRTSKIAMKTSEYSKILPSKNTKCFAEEFFVSILFARAWKEKSTTVKTIQNIKASPTAAKILPATSSTAESWISVKKAIFKPMSITKKRIGLRILSNILFMCEKCTFSKRLLNTLKITFTINLWKSQVNRRTRTAKHIAITLVPINFATIKSASPP